MKWYFDVEDEEDKEDVQSPPLNTTKTQKHSNVTLKNMIAEKIEKNVSSFAVYINQKLPSSVIGKSLKIGNTNVYRKKNNRHNIIYLFVRVPDKNVDAKFYLIFKYSWKKHKGSCSSINTFQGPFMSTLNTNDLDYSKIV